MDKIYMIHLDDYVRHIDDKLALYAMLRQLETAIEKLPENSRTYEVKRRMELFSPELDELWESWSIPRRYLVSGEVADLEAVMEEELSEPEDEGYFCDGSEIHDSEAVQENDQLDNNQAGETVKILLPLIDGILDVLLDFAEDMEQLGGTDLSDKC